MIVWKPTEFLAWSKGVPRKLNLTPAQAGTLLRNVAAAQDAEELGWRRLASLFPALMIRLNAALKATRAQRRNADLACRHYLCAEALVEVLEARAEDGRGRQGDRRGDIVDDYSQLVPARLKAFSKRPAAERRRIQSAYPDVNLTLVRRALREKILQPEFAAGVLEDAVNYQALVRKVRPASRRR